MSFLFISAHFGKPKIFVFVLFYIMGSKYINICIGQKISTLIYSNFNLPNKVNPAIFVFVFGPENYICHALP